MLKCFEKPVQGGRLPASVGLQGRSSSLHCGQVLFKSLIKRTRPRTPVVIMKYGSHGTRLRRPCGLAVSAEGRHAYLVDMARCFSLRVVAMVVIPEYHGNMAILEDRGNGGDG